MFLLIQQAQTVNQRAAPPRIIVAAGIDAAVAFHPGGKQLFMQVLHLRDGGAFQRSDAQVGSHGW